MRNRSAFFALVALIGLAALAQNLPMLNVNPASNRTVAITWPYTNSALALQELAGLAAASNWQSCELFRAFNSNNGFTSP